MIMMEEGREVFFVGSRVNKVRATQGSCVWGLIRVGGLGGRHLR